MLPGTPPKHLSPQSTYLTQPASQPGPQTVVRDTKGYGVKVPSNASMMASIAWHLAEAMGMSGGGFSIYGMVKGGYTSSAMAMHNWMLEADGREPLKPGSPEFIATEAIYQGLGDLVASSVAGAAHGVFAVLSAWLRPQVNSLVEWMTTPSGMTDMEAEDHVTRHFILTVCNPSLRVPLDNLVTGGFALNSLSSTYRAGTGDVDPSVLPGKAPAEGTYAPFDSDSAAVRNTLVGLGAMNLGLIYVKLKDGHLMWAPQAPLTKEGAGLAMASRHRAGYEMATSGVAGSKLPVFAAQGLLSALLATMKINGASEQQLAITNSALNGLLHFQRVHHWGHARRESELVGKYDPLLQQAHGPAQLDSLVRESKVSQTLRDGQFQPDPWLQEAMKATIPVLSSFFAAVAAEGILRKPYSMSRSSDWSVQGGPFSSINMQEVMTGMAIGLVFNQVAGQILPEPIPVPPAQPAVGQQPQGPATASKARKDIVSALGAISGGAVAGFTGGPGQVIGASVIALSHRVSVLPKNPAHSVMAHIASLVQSVSALWRRSTQLPQGEYQLIPPQPGPQIEVVPNAIEDPAEQGLQPRAVKVPENMADAEPEIIGDGELVSLEFGRAPLSPVPNKPETPSSSDDEGTTEFRTEHKAQKPPVGPSSSVVFHASPHGGSQSPKARQVPRGKIYEAFRDQASARRDTKRQLFPPDLTPKKLKDGAPTPHNPASGLTTSTTTSSTTSSTTGATTARQKTPVTSPDKRS